MFTFTIFIILVLYLLDITLSILNYRNRTQPIPDNVADVYNQEDYQRWLDYTMEKFRLSLLSKTFSTIVLIAMLLSGFFPAIGILSDQITADILLQTLVFLGLYGAVNYILGIGFSIYSTFNIEDRYGFNTTTVKTYILDQIKSLVMTLLLGGGLLYVLLLLFITFGTSAIFYAWLLIMAVILIINLLYTRLFIRLFNKLTPLPEGDLYDKSVQLAGDLGYEIRKISVMDASKRSTKINAFFTGFGRFKSIILYDTLLDKCETDEIVSILAHEIGHAKHKDVLKNLLTSAVQIGGYLIVLAYFLSSAAFAKTFGFDAINYGFAILLFGILMEPISLLLNIPLSAHSRKAEYRADACAAEAGYGEALCSALKVLARENFANLTPHPLLVKMTYSHPTISQRIQSLKNRHH